MIALGRKMTGVQARAALLDAGACAYFYAFIRVFSKYPIDDSFIHLRIARNIAEHGLPYFNLNEPVMGSTPHLWIQLLALAIKSGGSAESFLPILAFGGTIGAYFGCRALLRSRYRESAASILSWALVTIFLLAPAAGLMECGLAATLMLLSVLAIKRHSPAWAGALSALAIAVRLELCIAALVNFLLTGSSRSRLRFLSCFAPLALLLAGYELAYFRTLIPFPVVAKSVVYAPRWFEAFLQFPAMALGYPGWFEAFRNQHARAVAALVGSAGFCLSLWLVREAWRSRAEPWVQAITTSSTLTAAVYFARGTLMFSWYCPLITLPIGISALLLGTKRAHLFLVALFGISFCNFFWLGARSVTSFVTGQEQLEEEYGPGWRVRTFLSIGQELWKRFPGATVMAPEIGGIGWSFPGRILDAGALVTPAALKFYPLKFPKERLYTMATSEAVLEFQPDFIVGFKWFVYPVQFGITQGTLPGYFLWKSVPIFPPEEVRKTGVTQLWNGETIDVYAKQALIPEREPVRSGQ